MSEQSVRDEVVAAVLQTLPEFCQRNRIVLSPKVLENLAYWVTSVIPVDCARDSCPNAPYPCACMGACQVWRRVISVDPVEPVR